MLKCTLIVILLLATNTTSSRILGIFPTPSLSHQIVYQPIIRELVNRGHEFVSITPFPIRDKKLKNLTEIYLHMGYNFFHTKFNFAEGRHLGYGPKEYTYGLFEGMTELGETILQMAEVQNIINSDEKFDLVIIEWIFCPNMAVFSHKFQTPLIGITSFSAFLSGHDNVGNPTHPVYSPDFFLQYSDKLSFWQRLHSTYYNFWYRWYYYFSLIPNEDRIARKYFGNNIPYLGDILNNLSLLITNSHPILSGPRPLVPTTIEIGGSGLHIKPKKPLPKDIQEFLDSADQGVIYFSLGSNVKSVALNEQKRSEILSAFKEMPYKILWKWESDSLQALPKNVKISKWFPQQDILGHKNIKAFFMQGGLQSLEEAILNKVPLVGMPFFADQDFNVNKMVHLGIAVSLEVNTVRKEDVKNALYTVINDTRYKERITEISKIIYDKPIKSLDNAVWWIEFVLRNNGTKYLRSPTIDTPLYKHFLLDILLFLILCISLFLFILYKLRNMIQNIYNNRDKIKKL